MMATMAARLIASRCVAQLHQKRFPKAASGRLEHLRDSRPPPSLYNTTLRVDETKHLLACPVSISRSLQFIRAFPTVELQSRSVLGRMFDSSIPHRPSSQPKLRSSRNLRRGVTAGPAPAALSASGTSPIVYYSNLTDSSFVFRSRLCIVICSRID